MTEAMTAAEDRHFYTEGGVSLTGLMRAAYEDVFGSGNLQGGSTITMQYAKNYYTGVDTGRNFSTKLKEIFIAMKLGHEKSKPWVMTNYLNTVPFGATVDGLGAAAENYFSIDLTKPGATLTISQAAMLAAMPNAPGVFSPDPTAGDAYTQLMARWQYVLGNMVKRWQHHARPQANRAEVPHVQAARGGQRRRPGPRRYLMNMVEQQLEAPRADGGYDLTQTEIDTGGYRITTTFSAARMNALARSVSQEKAQMRQDALQQGMSPFQKYDRIGAVLENAKTGAIVAIYGGPGWPTSSSKRATKLCNQADCYLNTAEDAEQVGSSFKPYVLATAVKEGMSVFTSKLDGYSPIWIPQSGPNAQMTLSTNGPPPAGSSIGSRRHPTTTFTGISSRGRVRIGPLPVERGHGDFVRPGVRGSAAPDRDRPGDQHGQGVRRRADRIRQPVRGRSPNALVPQTIAACNDMTGPGYKVGKSWYKGNGLQMNFSPDSKDQGYRQYPGLAADGARPEPADPGRASVDLRHAGR